MHLTYTEPFKRSYKKLPKFIQKKADRILLLLGEDLMHPSIRAKKIQGPGDIWEGRIDRFHSTSFALRFGKSYRHPGTKSHSC